MNEFVTVKQLAQELGMDRSGLRKYALANGFTFIQVRPNDSRNQVSIALTGEDAQMLRDMRQSQGFNKSSSIVDNGDGYFYIIQLIPELAPNRVKVGFAANVFQRLDAHRTAAPTAKLVKNWPCKKTWEVAAIACITRLDCKLVGLEVYESDSVKKITARADEFFSIMPVQT